MLAIDQFFTAFAKIRRYYHTIEVVSGVMMVLSGQSAVFPQALGSGPKSWP